MGETMEEGEDERKKSPTCLSLYQMTAQKKGGHFVLLLLLGTPILLGSIFFLVRKLFCLLFEFFDFQFASLQKGKKTEKGKPLVFVFFLNLCSHIQISFFFLDHSPYYYPYGTIGDNTSINTGRVVEG